MNRQFAQGNLVEAASVITGTNGRDMLSFTVACNEGKTADGRNIVEYIPVVCYGKQGFAANLVEYLGKGAGVTAIGRLLHKRNEKENDVYTNSRIEVQSLSNIRLTGSNSQSAQSANTAGNDVPAAVQNQVSDAVNDAKDAPNVSEATDFDSFDDDIPF